MLKAVTSLRTSLLTFLLMTATSCLVFATLGILSWQMAGAVVVGSGIGSALARVRLAGRPVTRTRSRSGSAQ